MTTEIIEEPIIENLIIVDDCWRCGERQFHKPIIVDKYMYRIYGDQTDDIDADLWELERSIHAVTKIINDPQKKFENLLIAALKSKTKEPISIKSSFNRARYFKLTLKKLDDYYPLKDYLTGLKSNNYFISVASKEDNCICIFTQFVNPLKLSIKNTSSAQVENCTNTPQYNLEVIKQRGSIIHEIDTLRRWGGPR